MYMRRFSFAGSTIGVSVILSATAAINSQAAFLSSSRISFKTLRLCKSIRSRGDLLVEDPLPVPAQGLQPNVLDREGAFVPHVEFATPFAPFDVCASPTGLPVSLLPACRPLAEQVGALAAFFPTVGGFSPSAEGSASALLVFRSMFTAQFGPHVR